MGGVRRGTDGSESESKRNGVKIRVTSENSGQYQEMAFSYGFAWASGNICVMHEGGSKLYFYLSNQSRRTIQVGATESMFVKNELMEMLSIDEFEQWLKSLPAVE